MDSIEESRKKRGISTFIATLLLIVLVVAAGVLIYAYTMGYIGGTTLLPEKHSMQIQSIAEVNGQLLLYVKNIGTGSLKLDPLGNSNARAYVNDVQRAYSIKEQGYIEKLPQGATCTLSMAIDYPNWGGKLIFIKILADDGTMAETSHRVSSSYTPATLHQFVFDLVIPSPQTVGVPVRVEIKAMDQYGALFDYNGVNDLIYSGGAVTPATCTFNGGVWSAFVTFEHVGVNVFLSTSSGGISGQSNSFDVNPGPATTLTVADFPSPVNAGAAGSVTVTAKDAYGDTATGYLGTVHFTSSDLQAVLPGDYTFTAGEAGVHSFSVTLKTAGIQSITATDTVTHSITGSQAGIVVNPIAAATLAVAGFPSPVTAGVAGSVTVTAKDPYGNTAAGYLGKVHFTSSDGQAILPGDYQFLAGDNSAHTFTNAVTLNTASTQSSITATDTVTSSITGSQTSIQVIHASAVSSIAVTPTTSTIAAGGTQTYTATATDAYGNTWDVSTDAGTTWGITAAALGSWGTGATKNVYTSAKVGTWTVTGTYSGKSGTATLNVNHGAAASIAVTPASATITAGNTQTYTTMATDAYGNTWDVSTDAGTTWSISSGAGGSWAVNVYTSAKAGTWTVTGTYSGQSGMASLIVNPGTTSLKLVFFLGASQTLSRGIRSSQIAVQLQDQYGNPVVVTSSTTITLSDNTANGNFYRDQTGSTTLTQATIPAHSTATQSFFYQDSAAESATLTAARAGYTSGTTIFTITSKTNTPKISSTITPTTGIIPGTAVSDKAVLVSASTTPTGTVTYRLYRGIYPTGVFVDSDTVTISGGVVPSSKQFTGTTIKSAYYFTVEYSGDTNNNFVPGNNPEPFVAWPAANTELITPAGATTDHDLTPVGNAQNYICVQTNNGDTSYVRPDSSSTYDNFWTDDTYTLSSYNHQNTNYLVVHIVCRENIGTGYALSSLTTHGTEYDGSSTANYYMPLTSTYADYTTIYPVNPYTGSAWTLAEINSLYAGVSLYREGNSSSNEPRCTQLYIQMYYTP